MLEKRKVIAEIENYLAQELADPGSAPRAEELKGLLLMYKFMPIRAYGPGDVACPGALVELELNGARAFCLIVPKGGGLVTNVDGRAVQVVTPQSPLGAALLGKKAGEAVQVDAGGKPRTYQIVDVS